MGEHRDDYALLLLGEVVDWLGVPDWTGPQLPADLARRIAHYLAPQGTTAAQQEPEFRSAPESYECGMWFHHSTGSGFCSRCGGSWKARPAHIRKGDGQ